jgi:hypothetical protein
MEIQELLSRYNSGYDLLVSTLKQISAKAIYFKPKPDEWSISEIIVHLADSEAHGFIRAKKVIAESGGKVCVYNKQIWSDKLFYDKMDYKDALKLIRILRKNLFVVLELIEPEIWNNYIYHPESGKITLSEMIQLYVSHIDIHVHQINRNNHDWKKANESKRN